MDKTINKKHRTAIVHSEREREFTFAKTITLERLQRLSQILLANRPWGLKLQECTNGSVSQGWIAGVDIAEVDKRENCAGVDNAGVDNEG